MPPESRVLTARDELPFTSRGDTLLAVALLTALAMWAAGAPVTAHDFWIEPTVEPRVSTGLTSVALHVGDPGAAEPYAYDATHAHEFRVLGPEPRPAEPNTGAPRDAARESRVVGVAGALPAGRTALREPGVHLIGYRSTRSFLELEAERFESYLAEEGLDHVIARRARERATRSPGRELYSRCAKSVRVVAPEQSAADAPPPAGHDRLLGLTLELVPEASPLALQPDGDDGALVLPLRLLFRGEPLAHALVHGHAVDAPELAATPARTDAEGRVTLRLPADGRWVFATVHMLPAGEFDGDGVPLRGAPAVPPAADWESLWASLSMTVQARAPRVAALTDHPTQDASR